MVVRFSGSINLGGGVAFICVSVLGIGSNRVSGAAGDNSGTKVCGGGVFDGEGDAAGPDGIGSNWLLLGGVVYGVGLSVGGVVDGTSVVAGGVVNGGEVTAGGPVYGAGPRVGGMVEGTGVNVGGGVEGTGVTVVVPPPHDAQPAAGAAYVATPPDPHGLQLPQGTHGLAQAAHGFEQTTR